MNSLGQFGLNKSDLLLANVFQRRFGVCYVCCVLLLNIFQQFFFFGTPMQAPKIDFRQQKWSQINQMFLFFSFSEVLAVLAHISQCFILKTSARPDRLPPDNLPLDRVCPGCTVCSWRTRNEKSLAHSSPKAVLACSGAGRKRPWSESVSVQSDIGLERSRPK